MTALKQLQPLDRDELLEDVAPALHAAIRAWDQSVKDVGQAIDALVTMFPTVDADLWWDELVNNADGSRAKTPAELADQIATLRMDYAAAVDEDAEEPQGVGMP